MICPNCQLQQPDHSICCVRCHYPFRSQSRGFFTKSVQGYSRADAYAAMQRGGYPAQQPVPPPAQNYPQNPYYVPPQSSTQNQIQMMYDANGNRVYVQIVYDAAGNAFYVQMIPKIVGKDAHGNPVYNMVPAQTPPVPVQPVQNQPAPVVQEKRKSFLDTVSETPTRENAAFIAPQKEVPPVPVLPSSNETSPEPEHSVPDRPAMRATAIASSMYAANQASDRTQNPQGTGSYFSKAKKNPQQELYEMPLSAEELLKEEAETAFVQELPDEKTLLSHVFERQAGYYQENTPDMNAGTVSIEPNAEEITSVSERSLYQTAKKLPKAQVVTATPIAEKPEKKPEKPSKPDTGVKLFGGKKQKEQKKSRPVIVDADAFFGDSKARSVEMLGIRVDGSEEDVQKKLKEMRYGGKKSIRSMESADRGIDMQAMIQDPQTSDAARRALEGEEVRKVYDSLESAEIAKALEQLNQDIFPKKF